MSIAVSVIQTQKGIFMKELDGQMDQVIEIKGVTLLQSLFIGGEDFFPVFIEGPVLFAGLYPVHGPPDIAF
jgi:hypothetical protein